NSPSLLLSRISTLAIRLLSISDFVTRRPTGFFLRRIFFAQLVELFPGSLLLITLSLVFYRAGSPLRYRQALFLVLPVILIFLAMTQAKTNIGLRHILPIYPFLFVLASRLATIRLRRA